MKFEVMDIHCCAKKPLIFSYFSDDEESEDNISKMKEVDSVQKKLLAAAGQDVDAYMKEMEEVRVFFCLTLFPFPVG